jgi:two-component system, sensor histidine kinase and response regulator
MKKKPKILVVDDKEENLIAIKRVLRNMEVELITATNGNDALKETLNHDFVLALLDIQMPGMDGYELALILREEEKTAKLPFIFISAVFTDPDNIFKGYELGAFSFITKPFQPEILANKVQFFVEKHQHEVELEAANQLLEQKNHQLLQTYKELDFFTFSVSHNLRQPLRFIQEYLKIFLEEHKGDLSLEEDRLMNVIKSNTLLMQGQLDDLFTYYKLGKHEIRKSHINMNDLVNYALKTVINESQRKKIVFKIDELLYAYGDHLLLLQVVSHILSNAVKFSEKKEHPIIEIHSFQHDGHNVFHIKDNGVGFDMRYAENLFNVFQRLHGQEEFPGRGVELAFVKRIIQRHGGKVWVEAQKDKGADFYFSLPQEDS